VLFHLPRFLAITIGEDITVMTTYIEVAVIDAEVVEVLDESAARRLDGRIRVMAGSVRDQVQTLARLIDQAKAGEVHAVLGYPSWTAYIADVFSSAPLHLQREQRRELVDYLSGEGMSVRAIGQTVGADRNTVRSDLRQVGEFHPPENDDLAPDGSVKANPREFFDSDEEMAAAITMGEATAEEFESALAAARADEDLSEDNVIRHLSGASPPATGRKVTGQDGKTYPAALPAPRAPRRSALPDAYSRATWELRKAVQRLERLHADDRFPTNRETIAQVELGQVVSYSDRLAELRRHLSGADRDEDPQ